MEKSQKLHWQDRLFREYKSDLSLDSSSDISGYKNEFARDKARIVHSAHFRRLQGKTQVLGLGESDFYRTRLTHSIEVAQIGTGLLAYLTNEKYSISANLKQLKGIKEIINNALPEKELIETICLAHDIGHPPFGHGGEVALNYCMHNHGGFEGNAQTLRICTTLGEFIRHENKHLGYNLTKRSILGLIKYPAAYNSVKKEEYPNQKEVKEYDLKDFKPPKCIYDEDTEILKKLFHNLSNKNHAKSFLQMQEASNNKKHRKTKYKSFDTSIMEIADDIAYGVHDLEDAVALNLVSIEDWNKYISSGEYEPINADIFKDIRKNNQIKNVITNLFSMDSYNRKKAVSALVKYFIYASEIDKNDFVTLDDIESGKYEPLLTWKVTMKQNQRELLNLLQDFVVAKVIKSVEVQTLEFKGEQIIKDIFTALKENPQRLLHRKYLDRYNAATSETEKMRIICDYVSGMTDEYAVRLYSRLFIPSHGSIFHKL